MREYTERLGGILKGSTVLEKVLILAVTLLALSLFLGAVAGLVMGMWWLLWQLWLFVIPTIYPTGPSNFITPSYWLFAGMWTLCSLIGRMLRFSRGEKKS